MRQNAQNIIHGRPNPESGLTATVGTFDGVHTGHRYLLEELKRQAAARDSRPVAIVIDPHPLQIVRPEDAPPLLSTFDERRRAIESEGVEVFRLEFNERTRSETSDEFIAKIHDEMGVKTLLVGYDNRFGSDRSNGIGHYREAGRKVGLEVIEAVCLPGVSSSAVRKRLLCGDIEEGNRLLGYRYGFTGLVVGGARLGRRLGFPTANLNPVQPERLIPPAGVYATLVRTDETGDFSPSMTNIGHRPTVAEEDAPLSIETHIFDYEGDLYGRPVQVRFVSRLRDEKRFASVDELKAQLKADSADALAAIQNGKTI